MALRVDAVADDRAVAPDSDLRLVRALDLDDELEDSALDSVSGAEFPEATPDQLAQLESSLTAVREVIGSEQGTDAGGLSDKELRSQLWESYFDVEGTVSWALEEQHRRAEAAKKRAEAKAAKAAKQAARQTPPTSRPSTPGLPRPHSGAGTPRKASKAPPLPSGGPATPARVTQLQQDVEGLGLGPSGSGSVSGRSETDDEEWDWRKDDGATLPVVSVAKEKILEQIKARETEAGHRPVLGLVVVGHVDSGKSTLMGRLLHSLPDLTQSQIREAEKNQRVSEREGKGSFGWAWSTDTSKEERDRGVTIDITHDTFSTPRRSFTLIDAPGHADFVPNMISGAAQADAAFLVVDATPSAFEKGFEGGGQTREHAILCRSLGVRSIIVVVNKLDSVDFSARRYDNIVAELTPYLAGIGFDAKRVSFVPVAAYTAENLAVRSDPRLEAWYDGKTLVELMDELPVPERALTSPIRLPISNVFRSASSSHSGLAVSGRLESGILQVGDRVCVVPGDIKEASGVVRAVEGGVESSYATAGEWVTVFLGGIDPIYVNIGCVICPQTQPVPLAIRFTAQVVVFDIKYPLTLGSSVELYHHSRSVPAVLAKLEATLDKQTGQVLKRSPRMLSKGASATVVVKLRTDGSQGSAPTGIPLETFAANKGMGRVALRRAGETVAAGIVLEINEP